jgi:hypothetical protein
LTRRPTTAGPERKAAYLKVTTTAKHPAAADMSGDRVYLGCDHADS